MHVDTTEHICCFVSILYFALNDLGTCNVPSLKAERWLLTNPAMQPMSVGRLLARLGLTTFSKVKLS